MLKNMNKKFALVVTIASAIGLTNQVSARPNVTNGLRPNNGVNQGQFKTTAGTCKPAQAAIDLDINNVRARLMTGGDMWWDNGPAVAAYEVPKGSKKSSLFAGSVWIGGFDAQGQLKVAAQTYRQDGNDYWPGPLDINGNTGASIDANTCSDWDRFWKVSREAINKFRALSDQSAAEGNPDYDVIFEWPAKGNKKVKSRNLTTIEMPDDRSYAPFKDVDNDGVYDASKGDYPDITGDQFIWWVFNDKGNVKGQSNTEGIGVEVQASAFAYSTKDFLNDATFYNYRLINRGNVKLDSTYIATWTDADLGWYKDDYIGCDTTRGLGILYNGKSEDGSGQINSYGTKIPMIGIDFFKGPKKTYDSAGLTVEKQLSMEAFTYYNNDFSIIGNPSNGIQIYNYMTGSIRNGERFSFDFQGPNVISKAYGGGFPTTRYVFFGDPGVNTEWSECTCNNVPDDRRFVHSSGPFKLLPGVVNDITIGAVWVSDVGGCPNTSFKKIRVADDQAQALFDNNFQTIEGPEAPRMVIREMDRKLIIYLLNDSTSNNYQEKYGYDLTQQKYRVASIKASKYLKVPDSLYKFEGYRIFQLKNSEVQPAQIFDDNGNVNTDLAIEVFQCDIKNGVKRIINYEKNTEISDSTYQPIVKVNGKDSGIRHSFEVSIDQFATGQDKRIVNYHNYYFVAIAYAYNDFSFDPVTNTGGFNPKKADSTQDVAYIESSHGANSIPIPVVSAMPNPANGDMGTVVNANYGDGVVIKRIEGTGNGGNILQMTEESENQAVAGMSDPDNPGATRYQSINPIYKAGAGPVSIKVVDPLKVKAAEWELYLQGVNNVDPGKGMSDTGSTWKLVNVTSGETIYSETNISNVNEQILEQYGLAVTINQAKRPGDDQKEGNGYLTSDITFENTSTPWLAGVNDGEDRQFNNWIRAGHKSDTLSTCDYNDTKYDTVLQVYETFLSNNAFTKGTWAPYSMGSDEYRSGCGYGTVYKTSRIGIFGLPSVDIVFTSDKSKWTRCVVLEMQDDSSVSEGSARKFELRKHASWNGDIDDNGRPVYSSNSGDQGMSWFPGYAVNQETGERLNIIFSEDSWQKSENGNDMLWNPTSTLASGVGTHVNAIFGGRHYIYVLNSIYDSCRTFLRDYASSSLVTKAGAYKAIMYTGVPLLNTGQSFKSLADGFIPTTTRIRIRVSRPYAKYTTTTDTSKLRNHGFPLYSFSTADIAPVPLKDNPNADKQALLDKIHAVPNPYYGYVGYEINRLDTRVRIINLPRRATVTIYSLDGAMIRKLEKDNPNVSYIDWDIRNAKGLPIASGMYLIHVNAEGIGETVLRWFGAMRPLDITTY